MKEFNLLLVSITLLAFTMSGCGPGQPPTVPVEPTPTSVPPTATSAPAQDMAKTPPPLAALEISSSAFEPGGEIPVQYTCHGANLSPPLAWSEVPEEPQSLALLVDDPDSQPPGFVHWVIYNIPRTAAGLPAGVPPEAALNNGTLQGGNDFANYPGGTFPGGLPSTRSAMTVLVQETRIGTSSASTP